MIIDEIIQGSDDWHLFRKNGIGSSDSPVIMGVSPYRTPYQLWREKTSEEVLENKTNFAMQRGSQMEPQARAQYELLTGNEIPAKLVIHPKFNFLRASLDGYSEEKKICVEIKCPGKEDHAVALKGSAPAKYYPQVQHQLLVTGFDLCHYYSFDGEHGCLVIVKRDNDYIKNLLEKELEFWDLVQKRIAPAYTDADWVPAEGPELLKMMEEYVERKKEYDELSFLLEALKTKMIPFINFKKMAGSGLKVQKISRVGNIVYRNIPELKDVNLEAYRGKGSEYFKFSLEGEDE